MKIILHASRLAFQKHAAVRPRFLLSTALIGSCLSLAGCAYMSSNVPGSFSTHPVAPVTTTAGAVGGAIAGMVVKGGAGMPVGAVIGGAVGAAVGLYADSVPGLTAKLNREGIPVIVLGQQVKVVIYTDSCFLLDDARINVKCYPRFDQLAMLLKHYDNAPIKVAGYADDGSDPVYAKYISQLHADSLVAYLYSRGIAYQRFEAIGYGLEDPIATNRTAVGSAFNRRIELTFQEE